MQVVRALAPAACDNGAARGARGGQATEALRVALYTQIEEFKRDWIERIILTEKKRKKEKKKKRSSL